MRRKFDVLALGAVSVDDLLYVDSYPAPDEKAEVLRRERQCGGISGIALIAAARLGASCGYAGVLGRDELSRFAAGQLRAEGIDLKHLARRGGVGPIHSVILIDINRATRNIFFDISTVLGASIDWPPAEVIQSTRVLFADWFSVPGMIRATRLARQAGIPVVADFEQQNHRKFSTLLNLPDHLILSKSFAAKVTGLSDPRRALRKLWKKHHQLAAITCGVAGCWYL
ncbi:MAG TPA: PfkB family carbohydrate kinase, partial [Candidatus Saccharimonadales bacterium]|nr:PfkB family carbohydrate kinase [Candidatus Saccharimonadales bacterium]